MNNIIQKQDENQTISFDLTSNLMISLTEMAKILTYDLNTGRFTYKCKPRAQTEIGDIAGTIDKEGYRVIKIKNKLYKAHRLAWLFIYGRMPIGQIDHINHNRDDNRIENLRVVNNQENQKNRLINKNNKSGVNGVFWNKLSNKWQARIRVNSKAIHLGLFSTLDEAIEVREQANIKYGFHQNHGDTK